MNPPKFARLLMPKDDYQAARRIGIPLFALWIANTIILLGALMLRYTSMIYYSMGTEILFSLPLYLIISRNPIPPSELEVEVGRCENVNAWATYYAPDRIRIQGAPLDIDIQQQYCRAIIGLDHEYLHEILYRLEGLATTRAFDKLAGNLTDHSIWVGLNLTFEGSTRNFWESLDP